MEAVKKIVETEAQARRIIEEAQARAREILSGASEEREKAHAEVLNQVQVKRDEVLQSARVDAEDEARRSDAETSQQLESYGKAFENRKELAVEKAVELVLRG